MVRGAIELVRFRPELQLPLNPDANSTVKHLQIAPMVKPRAAGAFTLLEAAPEMD